MSHFRGIVDQGALTRSAGEEFAASRASGPMDWQNRPTFQQVVEFGPRARR